MWRTAVSSVSLRGRRFVEHVPAIAGHASVAAEEPAVELVVLSTPLLQPMSRRVPGWKATAVTKLFTTMRGSAVGHLHSHRIHRASFHSEALVPVEKSTAKTRVFTRPRGSDRLIVLMGLSALLSGYVFWRTNREYVFMNKLGRVRTMALSWKSERLLGDHLQNRLDQNGDERFGPNLPESDYRVVEITRIAKRILDAAEQDFFEIRGRLHWRLYVRENANRDAFCQTGGTLTINTGMFEFLVDAERKGLISDARDGLACVLAHEIAHGLCRHTLEHISWLPLEYPFKFLTRESLLLSPLLRLGLELPFSRMCENEADLVGIELMARAGYNPQDAGKVFKMLGGVSEFLEFASTHPAPDHRASMVANALPGAMEHYEKNKYRFESPAQKRVLPWLGPAGRLFYEKEEVQAAKKLSEIEDEEKKKNIPVKRIIGEREPGITLTGVLFGHNQEEATHSKTSKNGHVKRQLVEMDSLA